MIPEISAALTEAMEAMFFDAAEPSTECSCADAERISALLQFHDALEGEFVLSAPVETARSLAASFMGLDPAAADRAQAEQIVCELANIICGSALSRLDPATELRLTPPRLTNGPVEGNGALQEHYQLLDGCLSVSLKIHKPQ